MRLKTLKLKGFKSFADETVIHFDENVIGIVGPNGAGKSNIVDAIRWVLGEQKGRELRLESMQDVIFNGTKKRKPGTVAQVSITFDNTKNILPTEYQSVEITRILYRSGESEYRLNGVTCRLKDIHALLIDTGIGSNSYAIIALGMVDDILSDKDNARRRMFEQAAGIAKYKRRKHETLLKLKNTTADLDRIDDLLFEIDGNLKTLETQARRTKQYRDLREKYKTRSLELAVRKNAHLNDRYKVLSRQIEDEQDVLRSHEARMRKKEADLERLKKESLDGEKIVSEKQREINILIGRIRSIESDKSLAEQRISFLQDSVKKLQNQSETNRAKSEQIRRVIDEKTHVLNGASRQADQLKVIAEEKLLEKEALQVAYEKAKAGREHFTEAQKAVEDEHLELEKMQASLTARLEQTTTLRANYLMESAKLEEEHQSLQRTHSVLQEKLDLVASQLQTLEMEESARRGRVRGLQEDLDRQKESLHVTARALDARQNEFDLLKEMIEKLEGYPESIRFLSKSGAWQVKAPLLSDIIYCNADHRAKVEYVLAPYLNHFVVDTADDAVAAIRLLSSAQKGRAQFFVLDRCPPVAGRPVAPPGAIALLQYLQYDGKYATLVEQLLGHVFVVDGTPAELTNSSEAYRDYTLIDMHGLMFSSGHTLSGGSVGIFEGNKLGRAKNLELLAEEIRRLKNEHTTLLQIVQKSEVDIAQLNAHDQHADIDALRAGKSDEEKALAGCTAQLRNAEGSLAQYQQRMADADAEIEKLGGQITLTQGRTEQLREKLAGTSSEWNSMDSAFHRALNALSEATSAHQEAHLAFVQQRNSVQNLEHEISFRNQQMQELIDQIDSDQTQCESELQSIGEIGRQIDDLSALLIELYDQKKAREADLSASEQQYFQSRNVIHELEEKIRSVNREYQNSQFLINELKEEFSEIRFKLGAVSERLQIEFQTSLEELSGMPADESVPLDDLDLKVDRMRRRIENFGEINPMALEAYEEMKERFDAINAQRNDVLEAKQTLLDTIREIDQTATERFTDAFTRIREYFIDVFRHLFTEDDTCDLILFDPSNPLESEIEILAKPKGKRPKSLSQLSGGEKTLTATALLFALYLLKPAPFCIFDEVDAPLDDVNVIKFNKIIKNFSRDSQFVIVTHNKQTMTTVDVMYGVYMEELGVSNLSAVDFRHLEHEEVLEAVEA